MEPSDRTSGPMGSAVPGQTDLAAFRSDFESTLAARAHAYGVPGVVTGILLDDQVEIISWGVANTATRVEATPDTLFQIGSLTKIYTATLLMQMAAARVVELDDPVRAQLQKFSLADPGATLEVTPRHLLSHSSGIHGDHLVGTGWNPDALEKYVATLADVGQIHAPDETYSFCNAGFAVAGQLIETVTNSNFDQALRRRLLRPIGAHATLTLPHHALLHRVAVGHTRPTPEVAGPEGRSVPQPVRWPIARSNGPMGGVLSTAPDLLQFMRLHLAEGVGPDGTEVLSASGVREMAEPQIESPLPDEDQALAWTLRRWDGHQVLCQDADTFGQRCYVRLVPGRRFACCMLTNSPAGARLAHDLLPRLIGDLLDVNAPDPADLGLPAPVDNPEQHVGSYDRLHQRIDVYTTGDGDLAMAVSPSGMLSQLGRQSFKSTLTPFDPGQGELGVFRATEPETGVYEPVVITALSDGTPGLYLHGRLHRRPSGAG